MMDFLNKLMNKWLGMPVDASAQGYEVDNMIAIVHWFMLILFAGWSVFFIYTLIRFRRSRHPKANYEGVTSHASKYIEVGVVIFEAILLIGFAFPIWAKVVQAFPDEKNAVVVRVTGEQFAWNFHYPGPDGVFGRQDIRFLSSQNPLALDESDPAGKDDIVTLNQMHLPVGKPAIVHLTAKDVIHSFKIYEMRVNQDAIPGMSIPLWFEPAKTGKFEIVCAQLCGLGHYRMRGFLTTHTPEDFEKWMKEQQEAKQGEEW